MKKKRSAVTVVLMVGGCTPVAGQMQLERAQLFRRRRVGRPAEESRQPLDGSDVLALRIGRELADAHVFEHPLAQRTDGLLAHWGLLS